MRTIRLGFTIIEVTLVVAITGLIAAMVLAGIGTALNNERYTDATNQTIDYFQGLYSKVSNVANERPADQTVCTTTKGVGRGTSDCFVLGYIIHSTDGMNIDAKQLIARADVSTMSGSDGWSEKKILTQSSIIALSDTSDNYTLEWGVKLSKPRFSMMVVQIPLVGAIRTYIDTTSGTKTPTQLANEPVPSGGATFCIKSNGLFRNGGAPSGFVIDQDASNSSGVRQLSEGCS